MKTFRYCPVCSSPLLTRAAAGRDRLVCGETACGWIFWDNPLPVVAAIVQCADDVILVRNHGWPEKLFGLVSGFLERDETPTDGVLREVEEELGVRAELVDLVGVYPFVERNEVVMVWHVLIETDADIVAGDELAGWRRIPITRLRPWPVGTGLAVRDWLQRRGQL